MAHLIQNDEVHVTPKGENNCINRRKGNHHANLWRDDFIDSLSSSYGASTYRERVETLLKELKDIFHTVLEDGEIDFSVQSLFHRLLIVDIVERFGIDRYFQKDIKAILDNIYIFWNEKGSRNAIVDLNTTALGFRILRVNGYDVSADVFQTFKNEKGQFFFPEHTQQDVKLRSMLNLHLASELSFRGEKIMKDAQMFACKYLQEAREESRNSEKKCQLLEEVEYVLKYPWKCRVARWEARRSIEIYSIDDSWMMTNDVYGDTKLSKLPGKKLLELAILDFNILQAEHQSDLKLILGWWNESRVKQFDFFKHRQVEYFFWLVCGLFEPEFSMSRVAVTKLSILITLIDDIYDTYGTIEELKPFTTALITWDKIIAGSLPEYMEISFEFVHQTLEDIAKEAEKKHGPRVRKYMKQYWESYILSNLKEAEWIATETIPTFDAYLNNGIISAAVPMMTMHLLFLMDTFHPEDILEQINKIEILVSTSFRLLDDSRDFQDEICNGEKASCIECYVKDNPGSTKEDALNYINNLLDNIIGELKWEFLMQKEIPTCWKLVYFELLRGLFLIYKDRDGITFSYKETKEAIMKILVKPIIM